MFDFNKVFSVSEASELLNETLKSAVPALIIEGEVSGFNVNRGKFVFFDVKDDEALLPCFMMVFNLKFPLEDGMKVRLLVEPGLTAKGRFSLTVRELQPVGEGSLKKAFEMLKKQLNAEGLFAIERKRTLPEYPKHLAVVSSSGAAGWADFSKIISERWGWLEVSLANVAVQGLDAPGEIIKAIEYFNAQAELADVLVIIRGGGSAEDLAAFNHEDVVRAVAASRIPTVVGIGHETDESLSELAADVRASTPSNAAQLVVPEKTAVLGQITEFHKKIHNHLQDFQADTLYDIQLKIESVKKSADSYFGKLTDALAGFRRITAHANPEAVLKRGYAIMRSGGSVITSVRNVTIGDKAELELGDGQLGVTVHDKS